MLTVCCPHCQHAREVDDARIPRATVGVKCPACGQRFELDGAALHEATSGTDDEPLELDLSRAPLRSPLPQEPAGQPASFPAPPDEPYARPGSTPPFQHSSALGLRGRLGVAAGLALTVLFLGRCSVTSFHRPSFLQLRSSSEGARLSRATRVLVFLHGFGGSASDVEWFAEEVLDRSGREDLAIVMPDGPFSHWAGRAWFVTNNPAEREEGRARTVEFIRDLSASHGIPPERIYVGGFSQGAGMALDVAQSYGEPLGGVVLLSGCGYRPGKLPPMRILFGHGSKDSLCSFSGAKAFAAQLTGEGQTVEFAEHPGDHVLPEEIQLAAGLFLAAGL